MHVTTRMDAQVVACSIDPLDRIKRHPGFAELERRRNGFSWALTAVMVVIYGVFIALVAFAPGVVGTRIGSGVMTLGFPLGLAVILSAVALTGLYVWRANGEFDRLTRSIQESNR